jgi:hypothetical protein
VEAHLEVNILGDLVGQEIENGVGFRFGDTEYATGNARVDMNALPASYWVDTNKRVYSFDGLTTNVEASRARSLRLRDRTVQSCETLEVCLHSWAEGGIKSILHVIIRITSLHNGSSSTTYPELQSLSPPYSGPVITFKDVILGG